MRSIVPKENMPPYENVYRRQHDDENENQRSSDHPVMGETADRSSERNGETFRDEGSVEEEFEYDYAMSISELLYSTSSFYAIVVPGESKKSLAVNQTK
jgi:hypothetical protein